MAQHHNSSQLQQEGYYGAAPEGYLTDDQSEGGGTGLGQSLYARTYYGSVTTSQNPCTAVAANTNPLMSASPAISSKTGDKSITTETGAGSKRAYPRLSYDETIGLSCGTGAMFLPKDANDRYALWTGGGTVKRQRSHETKQDQNGRKRVGFLSSFINRGDSTDGDSSRSFDSSDDDSEVHDIPYDEGSTNDDQRSCKSNELQPLKNCRERTMIVAALLCLTVTQALLFKSDYLQASEKSIDAIVTDIHKYISASVLPTSAIDWLLVVLNSLSNSLVITGMYALAFKRLIFATLLSSGNVLGVLSFVMQGNYFYACIFVGYVWVGIFGNYLAKQRIKNSQSEDSDVSGLSDPANTLENGSATDFVVDKGSDVVRPSVTKNQSLCERLLPCPRSGTGARSSGRRTSSAHREFCQAAGGIAPSF